MADEDEKAKPAPKAPHPGMMGDGTEEQNLDQAGNPEDRISEDEVNEAFGDGAAAGEKPKN